MLSQPPEVLAAQAALCLELGDGRGPVVAIDGLAEGQPRVDVAAPDQRGLLANLALVLHDAGFDVEVADLGTWDDGVVIVSFRTDAGGGIDAAELAARMRRQLGSALSGQPRPRAVVAWDDELSPWHTVCRVQHDDVPGLLADLASAFAASGVEVHAAHAVSEDGRATNTFDLTDGHGHRLDDRARARVEAAIHGGASSSAGRVRWSPFHRAAASKPGDVG